MVKLPRKLKKKLTKEYGSQIVKKIISGELTYKANDVAVMTENGWKEIKGKKTIFMTIQ
jgi:hypothetical protein